MDNQHKKAFAFTAWSDAITYAIKYGGTIDDIRRSAINIGRGMMLKPAEVDAAQSMFNWREISR